MENIIYRSFDVVFKAVGLSLLAGVMASVMVDIHHRAFESRQRGLISMLKINEQLVGTSQ